jgi:glycogen synthase
MKILMLGWELPPHNSGGLGIACYHLCKALSSSGVDIEFVVPYEGRHAIDFMEVTAIAGANEGNFLISAYESYRIDGYQPVKRVHNDVYGQTEQYEEGVARLVEETEFDVIHAHDWLTFRAAIRAKELSNRPLIVHIHSLEADRSGQPGGGNPLVRDIESTALLLADTVIAVSEHTKKTIIDEYDIPEGKIQVLHNSINQADTEPLDDTNAYIYLEQLKKHGYKVVVNVGRLTIQKGLVNLLRAAKEVVERRPKTMFLFVGSGEQHFELLALAAELGISQNVLFAGFQRGKRWRDAYAVADLFVMPSISEPFGLTALEAVGYGAPVLLTRQSGVSEVLRHCLKIDFWDHQAMVNQITTALSNDALLKTLQKNAFKQYLDLSWQDTAAKFTKLYEHHIAEAKV